MLGKDSFRITGKPSVKAFQHGNFRVADNPSAIASAHLVASATSLPGERCHGPPKPPALRIAAIRGDQRRPRSKMENQISRHCELIMPSTVVVSLQIPSTLETQFRPYLDGCADPMTPRDRVL